MDVPQIRWSRRDGHARRGSGGALRACAVLITMPVLLAGAPARADGTFSAEDKRSIVQGFLSRAARLDAGDIHSHLTGVMGLIAEERDSSLLDFSLSGQNVGVARSPNPLGGSEEATPQQPPKDSRRSSHTQSPAQNDPDVETVHDGNSNNFADSDRLYRAPPLRPTDLLFGFRQPQQRETVYDLDSARFALASELGGDAARTLMKPMRFNFWLASKGGGEFSSAYDPGTNRRPDGWALSTGAHYKITPKTMFGALFRARSTAGSAPGLAASTDLESYGVGLYGGWALSDNITFSALGAYERGDNAVTIDGGSGRYGSDQLSLSANLRGYWRFGNWWLAPSASVTWNRTASEAYLDSAGDAVDSGAADTAQATFGPQIGYVFHGDEYVKAIRPRVALTGIYSFLDTGTRELSGGAIPGTRGLYGQALAGIDIWLNNRMTMNFDAGYEGIGAPDMEAWTVRGKMAIPFR
jgi:hypothetical protein